VADAAGTKGFNRVVLLKFRRLQVLWKDTASAVPSRSNKRPASAAEVHPSCAKKLCYSARHVTAPLLDTVRRRDRCSRFPAAGLSRATLNRLRAFTPRRSPARPTPTSRSRAKSCCWSSGRRGVPTAKKKSRWSMRSITSSRAKASWCWR